MYQLLGQREGKLCFGQVAFQWASSGSLRQCLWRPEFSASFWMTRRFIKNQKSSPKVVPDSVLCWQRYAEKSALYSPNVFRWQTCKTIWAPHGLSMGVILGFFPFQLNFFEVHMTSVALYALSRPRAWDLGSSHSPLQRPRANSPSGKLVAPRHAAPHGAWHGTWHGTWWILGYYFVMACYGTWCLSLHITEVAAVLVDIWLPRPMRDPFQTHVS